MESTTAQVTRAFIDSSALISAVLSSKGSAHDLIQSGIERRIVLVIGSLVLEEVERNLSRKSPAHIPELLRILDLCPFEISEPTRELVDTEMEHIEAKDAEIVAAAAAGHAKFLVTYDARHLLAQAAEIESRHDFVVCTPAVVLASMKESM